MYIHVPTPPPPPSAQARDVGTKIAELVRILRHDNPEISAGDVRVGLRLAEQELRAELGCPNKQALILALALLVGCGAFATLYMVKQGAEIATIVVFAGIIAAIGGVAAIRANRASRAAR